MERSGNRQLLLLQKRRICGIVDGISVEMDGVRRSQGLEGERGSCVSVSVCVAEERRAGQGSRGAGI